jgi:hypothetical protein
VSGSAALLVTMAGGSLKNLVTIFVVLLPSSTPFSVHSGADVGSISAWCAVHMW